MDKTELINGCITIDERLDEHTESTTGALRHGG